MGKEIIGTPISVKGLGTVPLSKAVKAGDFLFLSGQVALGRDGKLVEGDIEVQTRQVMKNLEAVLKEAGASLSDIVRCGCWITHKEDFPKFNEVYAEFFPSGPPARTTVVSELLVGAIVEIDAVAYLGAD